MCSGECCHSLVDASMPTHNLICSIAEGNVAVAAPYMVVISEVKRTCGPRNKAVIL